MLQNHIINKNFIEQILHNPNKKANENKNIPLENQLFTIIDIMLKESEYCGFFCYFIITKIKEKEEVFKVIDIIHNLTDIGFYNLAVEDNSSGQLYVHTFLAIRNLIGNNICIENNIRGKFLYEKIIDIEIIECKTILEKTKKFKYVIKKIFVSDSRAIFFFNRHWQVIFSAFFRFIDENKLEIIVQALADNSRPAFLPVEYIEDSKNFTINNVKNLFRVYFEEKKWYIYENNIYEIIPGTYLSVKYIKQLSQIEELYKDLTAWMIEKHWTTFFSFDFMFLKVKYFKQFSEHFLDAPATTVKNVNITSDMLEFKNGIYIISTNSFLRKNSWRGKSYDIIEILKKGSIKTINYYDKSYKSKKNFLNWILRTDERILNPFEIIFFLEKFQKYVNKISIRDVEKQSLILLLDKILELLRTTLLNNLWIEYFSKEQRIYNNQSKNFIFTNIMLCEIPKSARNKKYCIEFTFAAHSIIIKVNAHDIKKLLTRIYNEIPDTIIYFNKLVHKKRKVRNNITMLPKK